MKVSRGYLFLSLLVALIRARESASSSSNGLGRRAQEDILDAGLWAVHGFCDPLVSECTSNDMHVKEVLVEGLGANSHVTAVGTIELGALLCDSLDEVLDSTLLRFAISSTQTVIAERVYSTATEGDPLTDDKDRKVWIGDVVDPAPPAGSTASTISIAWAEPCDAEDFFLKMVTRKNDGSTTVVTSMPCAAGTSQELCLVETTAFFEKKPYPSTRRGDMDMPRRSLKESRVADVPESIRKLQGDTEIDILVLYSPEAMDDLLITSSSAMETLIRLYFAEVNLGNDNSLIPLQYNVIHVAELPYQQDGDSFDMLCSMSHSPQISALRNGLGADLVHMIWFGDDICGLADFFEDQDNAYGLSASACLDDLTIGHEIGHNLGCDHDRDSIPDEYEDLPYEYGKRYCTGPDPYITLMTSPDDECLAPYVNYYSNPDVMHLGRPTGTETENCARGIREKMDIVAAYRELGGGGCVVGGDPCTSTSDCCDSNCAFGVCGLCVNGDYRGDGYCDSGLNTAECGWDDGDCCECSNWATFINPDPDRFYECLEPDPQCLDNCPMVRTADYINDDSCDDEFNNADCRWDGGDCCQFSCEADFAECGDFNCLEVCDPLTSVCPDGTICCPDKHVCEVPLEGTDPSACGDPHMTGFLGQKFDFTGDDGQWYCLISDFPELHMNMRVTSPLPEVPIITYITGLAVMTTDNDGVGHSIVITVKDPHSLQSSCPAEGVSPCLADGALHVLLDGKEALLGPGSVVLGEDVVVSAVNLPGPCRTFGFEKYWERKKLESALHGRRLKNEQQSMGEWILGDPTVTNRKECMEYVVGVEEEAGGLFAHQSEHATFQIVTPKATIRLSHGRLHQVAMRDPTDQVDLPDHVTWQMNMGIDHNDVSRAARGILGETFVPTLDANGNRIMFGMESIRGSQEDYRVEGPLEVSFVQDTYTS